MKILFMGANDIGWDCCNLLLEQGEEVAAIYTIPKKFEISYAKDGVVNCRFKDFKIISEKYNVPLIYVESSKDEILVQRINDLQPDIILAIGWYYMVPKRIRDIPPNGVVGIHASLLPKYRGGAPLNWAILNGEKETGVTLFYFEGGVDDGDIIAQKKFAIEDTETIKDIILKARNASLELLNENISLLKEQKTPRLKQDNTKATVFPQRSPKDGLIDWNWDVQRIHNFIRALSKPYPGAYTYIKNKKVILWDAEVVAVPMKNESDCNNR